MARLAVFQPDARSGARLSAALAGPHELVRAESWEDTLALLDAGTVEGCLLDADHPSPSEAIERIERLRQRYPELALIGVTDRTAPLDYFRLGASGLGAFVAEGDGALTTRAHVDEAIALARGRAVERFLAGRVAEPVPRALGWSVAHASRPPDVEDLARGLGTPLERLRSDLRNGRLPSPVALLRWGRLVAAADRLHRDGRRIEDTCFALGYASVSSLARATRTQIGLTPSQLARRGRNAVLERFLAVLAEERRSGPTHPIPPAAPHETDHE